LNDLHLESLRISGFDRNGLDTMLGSNTTKCTVLATVVQNDLRLQQVGHFGLHRIKHIDTQVVRIDTTKARRMEINQDLHALDDLLEKVVAEHLRQQQAQVSAPLRACNSSKHKYLR
jgi:hypothetical protein